MIYPFVHVDTNEPYDVDFPMADAPSIGKIVEVNGQKLRRVASEFHLAGVATVVHGYPYVSSSLPRNMDGAKTNRQGKPIVRSRRHEKEIAAKHNLVRD